MKITATDHAVQRYNERVRPGLSVQAARADLERLIREHAQIVERPAWCVEARGGKSDATHWVTIGPDVVLPCAKTMRHALVALTVITNHGLSARARAKRTAERRAEKRRRQAEPWQREAA